MRYEARVRDNQLNKKHYRDHNGILMFDCEIVRDGRRVNNVVYHTSYQRPSIKILIIVKRV